MKNIAVLIIGFDPYKDVWDLFFQMYHDNWKKHPATYLATNELCPNYDGVRCLPIGKNAEWSRKVYKGLEKITEDYICLLLEDFFISKQVNNSEIEKIISLMEADNIKYYKMKDNVIGNVYNHCPYLKLISKESDYGISLQPAIWKKSFLRKLVGSGNYNAWIFEQKQRDNPIQNYESNKCICDSRNILHIIHGVVQQQYLPSAIKKLKKLGYTPDLSKRKVMNYGDFIKYRVKQVGYRITPKFARSFVKSIGVLFGFEFVSDNAKDNAKKKIKV